MFSRFIDVENFTIISEVCVIKKSYNHICAEIITYILQLPAYNILNIFRFLFLYMHFDRSMLQYFKNYENLNFQKR